MTKSSEILSDELIERFRSFAKWRAWSNQHPYVFSSVHGKQLTEKIGLSGIKEPLSQTLFPPDQVLLQHNNFRETIEVNKLISRHRAVLFELEHIAAQGREHLLSTQAKIYAPEALSEFALFVSRLYPQFLSSKCLHSEDDGQSILVNFPEKLNSASYANGQFDLFILNDEFEQSHDIEVCLREASRILHGTGVLLATFPFAFNNEKKLVISDTADDSDSAVPASCGNSLEPDRSVLKLELAAWDMIDRALEAGFADAYFAFICSSQYGIVGENPSGVFVFVADKNPASIHHQLDEEIPEVEASLSVDSAESVTDSKPKPFQTVAALMGLPRSGTTVFAAVVGAHPEVKAVFEPWNDEKDSLPSTNMSLAEFIDHFHVQWEDQQRVLFIKETAAELIYVPAIHRLLNDAKAQHQVKLIWLYREPMHAFLSEVQARKYWWGQPDVEANEDTFFEWAERSLRALRMLVSLGKYHDILCVDYGTFVSQPAVSLKSIMSFLGLEFIPEQMEYFKTAYKQQIRGDMTVTNSPRAISTDSNIQRELEAKLVYASVSQCDLYELIEAISKTAETALAGQIPSIEATKKFLLELDKVCSAPDMPTVAKKIEGLIA